jgi:DNA-binding NarL/FixJ family response regulator
LISVCERERSDLVLLDENLPPGGWTAALERVLSLRSDISCLILSSLPDRKLEAGAREKGALGVLDYGASPGGILAVLRASRLVPGRAGTATAAGSGRPEFSARELQILGLIAKGFSNKEISERLFLAEGTVKNRVTSILQKIGARDRGNAALRARELGLI